MEVIKLISNLYESNTYIVKNNNSAIIIDAGCELNKVKSALNGINVEAIFLTHLHFDHIYSLKDYVKEFNCKVYLFNSDFVKLRKFTLSLLTTGLVLPIDCYVSILEDKVINLNNFSVVCLHTPGHSEDSMCYLIENNLFSGDTLFCDTIGRTDLPTSNSQKMKESLTKLSKINFETCYSGHGEKSSYLDQQENIKYFLLEL